MLLAKKYLGTIGVGVTVPRMMRGDDGQIYVVKLKNNRLGTKVLVNEYIAACFSRFVELCFPPSEIMELTQEFIDGSKRLRRAKVTAGLHFASRYLPRAKYVHCYNFSFVKNKKQLAGVLLFDHLMHNADRTLNGKNMLLQRSGAGYQLYAIDNSHLFGSGRWRAESLPFLVDQVNINKRRAYGTLLKEYLRAEDFAPFIAQFKAIDEVKITKMLDDVPREWLDDAETKLLLKEFLVKRCANVQLVADQIIASIPDVNRRS